MVYLRKAHKLKLSSKNPRANMVVFTSEGSLRLNRPGSRVQPCRINRAYEPYQKEICFLSGARNARHQ